MTKSLKKGKRKRGVSYSRTELEKMIDEGLSVRDMAERLGTDSQQSVRHALERIKRERKEIEEIESEMEEMPRRLESMNRVGLLPYTVDDHVKTVLKPLLQIADTGLKVVNTSAGSAIVCRPDADFDSIPGKLFHFGIYGRLCSMKDTKKGIRVMCLPVGAYKKPPWDLFIRPIVYAIYNTKDSENIESYLFQYMEHGTIKFEDINDIELIGNGDKERILKSMQIDADKSSWHIHLEYNPIIIAKSGYIILGVEDNVILVMYKETLNKIESVLMNEMIQKMSQVNIRESLYRLQDIPKGDAKKIALYDELQRHLDIFEKIPVFPTEEQRRALEVEASKNSDLYKKRIVNAMDHAMEFFERLV